MISLGDIWQLLTGTARHKAEKENERAYCELEYTMRVHGIDGLADIDGLMRRGRQNGHDKPTS